MSKGPRIPPIESVKNAQRISGFSDAVFAVAITLLVLQIPIPVQAPDRELVDDLSNNVPMFVSYVISFWVIAQFWLKHLQFHNCVKHYSMGLVIMNFFYLLVITFLPYPTAVYGTHSGDPLAAVMYAGAVSFAGLISVNMWRIVIANPRLLEDGTEVAVARHVMHIAYVMPAAFAFSIIIVFIYLPAVPYFWVALGIASPLIRRL